MLMPQQQPQQMMMQPQQQIQFTTPCKRKPALHDESGSGSSSDSGSEECARRLGMRASKKDMKHTVVMVLQCHTPCFGDFTKVAVGGDQP